MIPRSWTSFRASRRFRGTTYDISVRQDQGAHASAGTDGLAGDPRPAVSVRVDGRAIEGTLVPLAAPGTSNVAVEVRLT